MNDTTGNTPERKTRLVLIIGATILFVLLIIGQCAFDMGVAYQIGKLERCANPPHVCTQP